MVSLAGTEIYNSSQSLTLGFFTPILTYAPVSCMSWRRKSAWLKAPPGVCAILFILVIQAIRLSDLVNYLF